MGTLRGPRSPSESKWHNCNWHLKVIGADIMDLSSNTVLVTGGASSIGLALAERFLQAGSQVIICGRREHKLQEAKDQWPGLHTRVCDVATEADRIALHQWAVSAFPKLNVLINNAGIQRRL